MRDKNRFALKEWAVIEKALSEGRQSLLLRKGGLIEQKKRFTVEHTEFFIYPTYLHQQRNGVIPDGAVDLERVLTSQPPQGQVVLSSYAVVQDAFEITDLDLLKPLEGHHLFNSQEVLKRFCYGDRPGLHLILLRVYRLREPFRLPVLPHYAGCRSWVDLERELPTTGCRAVLGDAAFEQEARRITAIVKHHPRRAESPSPSGSGPMTQNFDVIIVGGGTGGLVLALSLSRKGRSVAVVERQAELMPFARGELLQPNGLRILDQLGLLSALKALPVHLSYRYHFYRIGGEKLCTIDYRMLPPPWNYTLIALPHHLLGLLLGQLRLSSGVRLFTGTDFEGLLFHKDKVAGIRARRGEETLELGASIVVGSDGAHSRVREALGIRARLHHYREAYLTMVVPRPAGFTEDARYYLGQAEILGLFPVSDKELYLFYMIPVTQLGSMKRGDVKVVTRAISKIDASLAEPLQSITSWDQVGYMPCVRVRAQRWTTDNTALLGDAAHAMNPHVAQGRNQAMEDAMALAAVIEDCFAGGEFTPAGLDRYEMSRRPAVELLQRIGDELTLLWNTGLPPLCWLRDRIFEGMERHPVVCERVVKTISGLKIRPMGILDRLRVFLP